VDLDHDRAQVHVKRASTGTCATHWVDMGALVEAGGDARKTAGGAPRAGGADAGADFAPGIVASIIASYARRIARSDLVVLGWRSGPGDSGTVPFRVAETLGWPCLTQVTEIEPLSDGRLRVACVADDGPLRLTLRGPCVLAVGNAVVSHLRVPTLKDRLARRDRPIEVLPAADLGVDVAAQRHHETCLLTGLETIDRSRRGPSAPKTSSPRGKFSAVARSQLRPKRSRAASANQAPIASELVAAGDGAFWTCKTWADPPMAKSSTILPAMSIAWARTPD